MDTIALARHYEALDPWERVTLMAAASARGDQAEVQHLLRSAPRKTWQLCHHWGLAEGFRDAAVHYMMQQLRDAAYFWHASSLSRQAPADDEDLGRLEAALALLSQSLRVLAYGIVARADAWSMLCSALHIDGTPALRLCPGYEQVAQIEEEARRIAFTAEEAAAHLASMAEAASNPERSAALKLKSAQIATPSDIAAQMRQLIQRRLDDWS